MTRNGEQYATIESVEQLREIYGEAGHRAQTKERIALHPRDRQWLAASPLVMLGTCDEDGRCDVSPKGDPAGSLVHIIDDRTIAIPDRPGNRRIDGFRNIIANPYVGMNFVIPGRIETLRINGHARLVSDAPFFDALIVKGHRPRLAMIVDIETIFFHCGKAFLRSELWKPETWNPDALPSHACITKDVQDPGMSLEELEAYYGPAYAKKIYVEAPRIESTVS
ncbi:MAG TPA: pyridoxamine 5'-phosphate oxidase family protein [Micromonosporaceae bacterium]